MYAGKVTLFLDYLDWYITCSYNGCCWWVMEFKNSVLAALLGYIFVCTK